MAVSLIPSTIPGVCRSPRKTHPGIHTILGADERAKPTSMHILAAHSSAYQPAIYGNCVHTQYAALAERHICDRTYIGFDKRAFRTLTRPVLKNFYQRMGGSVLKYSLESIVNGYSGGKRAVYERARLDVTRKRFDPRWAQVKMFVKPDKIPAGEIMEKAPRAIQFRSPQFNLLMATYLKPLEKMVYELTSPAGFRVFAKGRNLQERAADIIAAYDSIPNCVVIEADHKKFDSCVTVEHLKFLHSIYLKFHRNSYFLKFLLNHQLYNKGRSPYLRYKVKGTRMSGDFDTALGNSLLNYFVLAAALTNVGVERYELYIDGDDSLIFLSKGDVEKFSKVNFAQLGFETEWQVKNLITAEFCKAHVIRCDPPVLARHPHRVMAHLQVCLKEYGPSTWPELFQGKLVCEYWANQGIPYVAHYITTLLDRRLPFKIPVEDLRRWSMVCSHAKGRVTQQAYFDMIEAFDFGHEQGYLLKTPVASAYCESGPAGKHSKTSKKKRMRYVWSAKSILRTRATFSTLDCSPSLRCGAGCGCGAYESRRQCGELAFP